MSEGRDWTRMQFEPCPDCTFDPTGLADRHIGRALTDAAADWGRTLARVDASLAAIRPAPEVWSALEYACHVRDVLGVFDERVRRTLEEDTPSLGWWDHEAAVVDDGYADEIPVLVAEAIGRNARVLATTFAGVPPDAFARAAVRREGEHFTVAGMGRFALHELVHHRHDAERGLADLGDGSSTVQVAAGDHEEPT